MQACGKEVRHSVARPALVRALEWRVQEARRLGKEMTRLRAELTRQCDRTDQIQRTNTLLGRQMAQHAHKAEKNHTI